MATQDSSIADVIKSAIHDAQDLVRGEIALAKAEIRAEVSRIGASIALFTAAAVAAVLGLAFLMTALAWAISAMLGWPAWAGFAIVAGLMLAAAAALAYMGRSRLNGERHMPLTVDTLKENMKWMRARTS
jgi:protein-S-isoprenylcysteine O-methyltransferase Ste14